MPQPRPSAQGTAATGTRPSSARACRLLRSFARSYTACRTCFPSRLGEAPFPPCLLPFRNTNDRHARRGRYHQNEVFLCLTNHTCRPSSRLGGHSSPGPRPSSHERTTPSRSGAWRGRFPQRRRSGERAGTPRDPVIYPPLEGSAGASRGLPAVVAAPSCRANLSAPPIAERLRTQGSTVRLWSSCETPRPAQPTDGGDPASGQPRVAYGASLKLSQYQPRYCIASENFSKLAGFVT